MSIRFLLKHFSPQNGNCIWKKKYLWIVYLQNPSEINTCLIKHNIQWKYYISDDVDEQAVQRSFMFIKKTLNFEALLDELNQRNLLSEKDCKEYVFNVPGKHFRCEKFLKLMIKRRQCKDFVACLHETSRHNHIWKKIKEIKDNLSVTTGNVLKGKSMQVERIASLNSNISNLYFVF